MTATVTGVYRRGRLELLEEPLGVREGRVNVTIEETAETQAETRFLEFGKYQGGRGSTSEDFKEAEWHGESEFDQFSD